MPHLLNVWPSVSRQLSSAHRVLLLFDYDGTLTPIVARPEIATLTEETRQRLTTLSRMDRFVVGVVSGRSLADVESLVDVPGVVYAGNHGLEISGGGNDYVHPQTPSYVAELSEITETCEKELAEIPGILVDNKRLTLTVHFRSTPDRYSGQVDAAVVAAAAPYVEAGRMRVTRGKRVVEVRPNLDWDKGKAILKIREDCGDRPLPVFFGDDQTDEDGFSVVQDLGGLAVFIGPPRERTKALHQLESPAEVGQVLALLAGL